MRQCLRVFTVCVRMVLLVSCVRGESESDRCKKFVPVDTVIVFEYGIE